ncbi:unnamed protein product [Camellia sinensis]
MCAGIAMAKRMFLFSLASILHSCDWKLPEGEKLDLSEKFGIVLKKRVPLMAIPTPGLSNPTLYKPFLKTSKTKIDVHSGTLTTEFDGEIVKFNIYDAMKYPSDDNPVYSIDVIDSLAQEVFELDGKDGLEVAISKHLEKENEEFTLSANLLETVAARGVHNTAETAETAKTAPSRTAKANSLLFAN